MRAVEIADLLELPRPTPEQVEVIEAGLEPVLVVAGAGSGKTETMAGRVVHLVANGLVEPDRILGLTFTRKAASELGLRIRRRLTALAERAGSAVPPIGTPPTVSTYNSYASSLVAEHGLRIGVETDARLMGEAALWQLATAVVEQSDVGLETVGTSPGHLTGQTVHLLGQCAEHLLDPADVARFSELLVARIEGLPGTVSGDLERVVRAARTRAMLTELVARIAARKRELGVLDFADQVAHAARLARLDDVAALERDRFEVVLLDEYQDTSVAQLELLSGLFGRHSVTAVGDPHQSIYGWRGASAGNLEGFPDTFRRSDGEPARVLSLATSWRNDAVVLDLANTTASPLVATSRVELPTLRARPGAGAGQVRVRWHETVTEEIETLADDLAARWHRAEAEVAAGTLEAAERPSHAVLSRRRKDFAAIETALRERGLPVRVFGLGGLLDRPEVGDVVATLQVIADPTRGDALMRLLTGPRWRIGPRDLRALHLWAGHADRQAEEAGVGEMSGDRTTNGPEDLMSTSIVEALDDLPAPDWEGPGGVVFSAAGYRRLTALSRELARLRRRTGIPLVELIAEVERVLRLDVELAAWPGVGPASARSQLDEFADVAAEFTLGAGDGPVLPAFMAWLDAAVERERGLELADTDEQESEDEQRIGAEHAERREIHLLTVHASKGLEWDVVAVPCLTEGAFPSITPRLDGNTRDSGWSTDAGMVPYDLRGDRPNLPVWNTAVAPDTKALAASLDEFRQDCGAAKVAEERRLAYVAFTRARHELLLSGSWWRDGKKPRIPSRFLLEGLAAGLPVAMDDAHRTLLTQGTTHEANPTSDTPEVAMWPVDPLGPHRDRVREAAELVRRAAAAPGPSSRTKWSEEVDVLLAERERSRSATVDVELPRHVSASRAVQLARDPRALALDIRRPVPEQPTGGARRGSAFHAWLEQRFAAPALVDLADVPGAADAAAAPEDLARLQQGFERSGWAQREVIAVESDIETPVAGTILRGRVDAVFSRDDGGVDIVDWKTGRPPTGDEARTAAVQLAVYRVAWSRLHDLPLEKVHASFCYVATGRTVSPVEGMDEAGLLALVQSVPAVEEPQREEPVPVQDAPPAPSAQTAPAAPVARPRDPSGPPGQLTLFDLQ